MSAKEVGPDGLGPKEPGPKRGERGRGTKRAAAGGPDQKCSAAPLSLPGLAHLAVVYVVWGSTYLAIRVAVQGDRGIPPFLLGAIRTLGAAPVLLLWGWLLSRRRNTGASRLRPTRREWTTVVASGILLWVGGNGMVNLAERHAGSGYAALLIGTTPIWVALMEAAIDRRRPGARLILALLVGFAGLAVLTAPALREAHPADLRSIVFLLIAPISWGAGSLLQARRPIALSPAFTAGLQQLFGGAGFLFLAFVLGERWTEPHRPALIALAYLLVAGSIFAFTSFLQALRRLPTRIVMTYAYANPVIAVFLGRLILKEPVGLATLGGTLLILLGVAGVFHERGGAH